ncbi:hypothetical protein DFP73DRAFT_474757 [Morchella snyderi]|nr:hypothetical protein DFP73DRAFT_474757 [Morchella snyderi]
MSGYVRMGRGGAGNTFTQTELEKKEEDIEAQEPKTAHNDVGVEETSPPGPPAGYKHMGRGGAGNWFVPSELAGGVLSDQSEAPTPEPPAEHGQSVRIWRGRGGAGNYAADAPQQIEGVEKAEAERAKAEEAKVKVDVEQKLQKPRQAHMKNGEKGDPELGWREAGL